jgi:F-type H+-transporting ATPase subunit b
MNSLVNLAAAQGGPVQQIVETFGLNWWLFLSQCISFSLVAFLLHKFAYQPILAVLEERRAKIAQSIENAGKIQQQLEEAKKTSEEILSKASSEAQRMVDEARSAAKGFRDRQEQQAIADAEQIVLKAREASRLERDQLLSELRREVARLVVATTAKVAGKVLTADDHKRLSEEASREIAA